MLPRATTRTRVEETRTTRRPATRTCVQRDDRAARHERGSAPTAPRRRRARAPDAALRDPGEPRSDPSMACIRWTRHTSRSVLEETTVMSRLLDDLQTLSTAEAGALTLHREQIEPRQLIDAAVDSFTAQAKRPRRPARGPSGRPFPRSRSIASGSARSSATCCRTRSATRRAAARSSSTAVADGRRRRVLDRRHRNGDRAGSSCRTSSIASRAPPTRRVRASVSRSRRRLVEAHGGEIRCRERSTRHHHHVHAPGPSGLRSRVRPWPLRSCRSRPRRRRTTSSRSFPTTPP